MAARKTIAIDTMVCQSEAIDVPSNQIAMRIGIKFKALLHGGNSDRDYLILTDFREKTNQSERSMFDCSQIHAAKPGGAAKAWTPAMESRL